MKDDVGLTLLTNAILISDNFDSESIVQINHEGYCNIYINQDLMFSSVNTVKELSWRDYTDPNETDGADFYEVKPSELNYLLTTFKFRHVK